MERWRDVEREREGEGERNLNIGALYGEEGNTWGKQEWLNPTKGKIKTHPETRMRGEKGKRSAPGTRRRKMRSSSLQRLWANDQEILNRL
jgi:hypothetical protein